MAANKCCLVACAIAFFVLLMVEDLTCLYNFDSDNNDESLYIGTLYAFLAVTVFSQAIIECFDSRFRWIYTVFVILVEIGQAILMTIFVGGFTSTSFGIPSPVIFGVISFLQAIFEVGFFFLSKTDQDDTNNDNSGNSRILRMGLVVVVGIYTIPGLWMTDSFQENLYSIWMDTIFTIGIIFFDSLMFLFENKIIGAPSMTDGHYIISFILTFPIIIYIGLVAILGAARIFSANATIAEGIYIALLFFTICAYIGLLVCLGLRKSKN